VPTMPAATVITTTLATPPRRRRRAVDGSGAAEIFAVRSVLGVAGAFGAAIALETVPLAVLLVRRCGECRAKSHTSAAPRRGDVVPPDAHAARHRF
jgi:hypothetical protein